MNENLKIQEFVQNAIKNAQKDNIRVIGIVHEQAWDKHGNKILDEIGENLITNAGFAELANLAGNVSTPAAFTYLANGSDNTAAAVAQTALVSENTTNGAARAAATVTRETTNVANDTLQLVKSWSITGAVTVQEVAAFNAASAGTMLNRYVTSSKTFDNGDTYQVTYKLIFA